MLENMFIQLESLDIITWWGTVFRIKPLVTANDNIKKKDKNIITVALVVNPTESIIPS